MIKFLVVSILALLANGFVLVGRVSADSPYPNSTTYPLVSTGQNSTAAAASTAAVSAKTVDMDIQTEVYLAKLQVRETAANVATIASVPEAAFPRLGDFSATVQNGHAGAIAGVFVSDVLALKVVDQPAGNPMYIASAPTVATHFGLADQYGTTGLLAHNYLAGRLFSKMAVGQSVQVVLGDGAIRQYAVAKIRRYQALRPTDPYSPFLDLDNGAGQLSSTDVFNQVYGQGNQLVFQTCIQQAGEPSWGRLFVTAVPVAQ